MKNILIIYPTSSIKKKFFNDERIIYFDNDELSVLSKGSRVKTNFLDVSYDKIGFSQFDSQKIINKLNKINPVWSRWVDRLDLHDLYLRESVYQIICLIHQLNINNISYVIFPTAVAHHLDTSFFEIACSINKINQIYLYNWFGRLIPTIQLDNIKDRQLINKNVSNYNFEYRIKDILNWKKQEKHPENMFSSAISQNYYFALLHLLFLPIKKIIKSVLFYFKIISIKNHSTIGQFPSYSYKTFLNQINQQRNALKFYRKISVIEVDTDKISKEPPRLLIAAHYQPEATSFPEGGSFYNHIDIVLKIRALGYEGDLYYKEHKSTNIYISKIIGFSRVAMYRSIKYYEILQSLGCTLIDSSYPLPLDPDKNKWFVPITITGTIAIERSLAGLQTIIMGEPWFKGLPGTIHIDEIDSLKTIDSKYSIQNNNIAKDAYLFLKNCLNNKTIANGLGISSGSILKNEDEINIFIKEFENLMKIIKNR
jgi:hypothetical protein